MTDFFTLRRFGAAYSVQGRTRIEVLELLVINKATDREAKHVLAGFDAQEELG